MICKFKATWASQLLSALFVLKLFDLYLSNHVVGAKKAGAPLVLDNIVDHKEFKKVLRTRINVLTLFHMEGSGGKSSESARLRKLLEEVAVEVKGLATVIIIDCDSGKEVKKLCKKLKITTSDNKKYVIKHYKDGDFHKDYDRSENIRSLTTFLKDPTGDLPWDEDPAASDVVHLDSPAQMSKFLKSEKGRVLVMFYAPWCGHCKRLKPDYQTAAAELKKEGGKGVLAAMDVNKPANSPIAIKYNITGYPTLLYFESGALKYPYPGDNNKNDIKQFLANPKPQAAEKPKEVAWKDEPSEVVHLTDDTFDEFMTKESSVLVMFYAPWCGHCKRAKPQFMAAAAKMAASGVSGKLAAVDCTVERSLGDKFQIKGFPTIKYFRNGEFAFDAGDAREEDVILKFMKDPKEPPPPPPKEKPWSEEESLVVHLDESGFKPFLKKRKHVLVMFYAPWCGHCKKAKPEFTAAADNFADSTKVSFGAVDCTESGARSLCSAFDVSGFPTFKYFSYYNKDQKDYNGGRTSKDFIKFMNDPGADGAGQPPPPPSPEEEWQGLDGTLFLKHLTSKDFDDFLRFKENVLIMFYAPWCGHCKAMKPDYARAAKELTDELTRGTVGPHVLATVDATANPDLAQRFSIRGFPTIKLFRKGQEVEDYQGGRKAADFVAYIQSKSGGNDSHRPTDEL